MVRGFGESVSESGRLRLAALRDSSAAVAVRPRGVATELVPARLRLITAARRNQDSGALLTSPESRQWVSGPKNATLATPIPPGAEAWLLKPELGHSDAIFQRQVELARFYFSPAKPTAVNCC